MSVLPHQNLVHILKHPETQAERLGSKVRFLEKPCLHLQCHSEAGFQKFHALSTLACLRSFKLWNWPSTYQLTERLIRIDHPDIKIPSIELVVVVASWIIDLDKRLYLFLKRFGGLRDVYLLLPARRLWDLVST